MDVTRKDATITNTSPEDEFPGSFEVILSAPTKDRDGDTLLPDEWKQPLPDHITFDMDHGMSVAATVGSGVPRIDEETGNLVVAGTYSSLQRAQEVRTLVNEGHIRTTSVAFMSEKSEEKDGKTSTVRELLNGAFVAIPSNREALVLASKGIKAGARNSAADAQMIQDIHDHAASLGAACSDAKAIDREEVDTKDAAEASPTNDGTEVAESDVVTVPEEDAAKSAAVESAATEAADDTAAEDALLTRVQALSLSVSTYTD